MSVSEAQVSVTLVWGSEPRDLDMHCHSSKGEHVYFAHKKNGNLRLDVDEKHGNGPETLTVDVERGVTYWFYVHHFDGTGNFTNSNAKLSIKGVEGFELLEVTTGEAIPYGPPDARIYKGYWHAFLIQGDGKIQVVNQIVRDIKGMQIPRSFDGSAHLPPPPKPSPKKVSPPVVVPPTPPKAAVSLQCTGKHDHSGKVNQLLVDEPVEPKGASPPAECSIGTVYAFSLSAAQVSAIGGILFAFPSSLVFYLPVFCVITPCF